MNSTQQEEFKNTLKNLTKDLKHIDLNLIDKNINALFNSNTENPYSRLAEYCAYNSLVHPEWSLLAGRLKYKDFSSNCGKTFWDTTLLAKHMLHPTYFSFVEKYKDRINSILIQERDLDFDWFGICTALKSYLIKTEETVIETPQQLFLRVAIWIWMPHVINIENKYLYNNTPKEFKINHFSSIEKNFAKMKEVYDDFHKNYIHATPTLFNSGLKRPQLSSCFLMTIGDSMESISESWRTTAIISKNSGGIGIDISDIRHSSIGGSSESSGIVPMLKCENSILNYVDQGGKRKGSAAIYLSDYHIDIFEFIELKKNGGSESMRARDLFYALWISDLFMERVEKDELWSLFCPNIAKGLNDVWGDDFKELYLKYEREEKYKRQVSARELWKSIFIAWKEVGMPFILFKDACNRKSNQQNLGTIRCSNLCTEILEYTSKDEIANCNLATVALPSCVRSCFFDGVQKCVFDYGKLERLVRSLVRNINNVIDINYYPSEIPQIQNSNLRHRPMGIGVQGLADVFAMMDLTWESKEASEVNNLIFETIYYASLTESNKIAFERHSKKEEQIQDIKNKMKHVVDAKDNSKNILNEIQELNDQLDEIKEIETTYSSFQGSPMSKGFLQFDLWVMERLQKESGVSMTEIQNNYFAKYYDENNYKFLSGRYNWEKVRSDIIKYGLRNSLLLTIQPTASTAQLLGNNECIEPFTGLIYKRTVLSGQFMIVNKHMIKDFMDIGVWGEELYSMIIENGGSVQSLKAEDFLKEEEKSKIARFNYLKDKYKTVFELDQKITADLALQRGRYICQTQSFNIFMDTPTYQKMTSMMFYLWKNGAKTGMYYLRSRPKKEAIDIASFSRKKLKKKEVVGKYICNEDVCLVCQ